MMQKNNQKKRDQKFGSFSKELTTIEKMMQFMIPAIEKMILSEQEHIKILEARKASKIYKTLEFVGVAYPMELLDKHLASSRRYLAHYQTRLKEYREFVEKSKKS